MKIDTIGIDNRKYTYEESFFSEKRSLYIDDVPLEMVSKKLAILKGETCSEEVEIIGSSLWGIRLKLHNGEIVVIFKNTWLDWLLLLLPTLSLALGIVLGVMFNNLLRSLLISVLATLVGVTANSQLLRISISKYFVALSCIGVSLVLTGITFILFATLVGF